ncbi:MAG TPA: LysR family transcriptional regulator [Gemmatimonadaceae bacterium]|nr:LysR family transcriptional regulator [Gemmatimonadaceae bacterium]
MAQDELGALSSFLAVAEARSFSRAATRLGVSRSALSHSIRGLEERLGVRLLARTTRSVATTYAGEQLLTRLRPAVADINGALGQITELRSRPAGMVKLVVSPLAAMTVLAPKLGEFARKYPDVKLDVTMDERRAELVAGGYDAGIHLMEYIQQDMIAVRVSPDLRAAIVASPKYFKSHAKPVQPRDLLEHQCLNFRHGDDVYRWEFEKGKREVTVAVNGPLVVDSVDMLMRAAIDGVGIAFIDEARVARQLASGELVRVLEDWCQPFAGFYLYYASRRQVPAALGALVDTLRIESGRKRG